jgi:hypothetical protein
MNETSFFWRALEGENVFSKVDVHFKINVVKGPELTVNVVEDFELK